MDEDSKVDDISEISERDTPRKNKEQRQNIFQKKTIMNKKPIKKEIYRSRSVAKDNRNKNEEIKNKNNNRYNNLDEEEQKNNNNKKQNLLKKNEKLTKIFLKNKDYLKKSIHLLKKSSATINQNNNNRDSINVDKYEENRRKANYFANNFKFRRNNSCIDLRPVKRKKISVTCLKFASNVSKDNDGLILFENGIGVNNCFLNAIVQVLYHLEEFRYKLMAIKIKKEINDPVFQLYTIFNNYESLSKLNTIEMLNSALLRRALHAKFGTYPKGKFGDPVETINELLELIHKEYFESNENNSKEFCKDKMCPSHSNFLLYLNEIKFCPICSARSVQKYDKDCFMLNISASELFYLIEEKDEDDFYKYKYSLFKKAKYLSQNFSMYQKDKIRLEDCKCKNLTTRKKLFLYKQFSPFLIINMTWDSDFPRITDICRIYGSIPVIDKNNNIFDLYSEDGKKKKEELNTKYYLQSMILFGQRHYTCFFYNADIKKWSFADDEKKRNYSSYYELIAYLISRRSFPVAIIYNSVNIFLNENEEKFKLNEEKFSELYKSCMVEEQVDIEDNAKLNKEKEKNSNVNNNNENDNNDKFNKYRNERERKEENTNNKKKKNDNDDSDSISF